MDLFTNADQQAVQHRRGRIRIFRGKGREGGWVAGTLGLQNQWDMPKRCCNLRTGT